MTSNVEYLTYVTGERISRSWIPFHLLADSSQTLRRKLHTILFLSPLLTLVKSSRVLPWYSLRGNFTQFQPEKQRKTKKHKIAKLSPCRCFGGGGFAILFLSSLLVPWLSISGTEREREHTDECLKLLHSHDIWWTSLISWLDRTTAGAL